MKLKRVLLLSGVLFVLQTNADAGTAIINWTGNAGYRAEMTMTFDDAFATVLARGDLSFSGPPTNQGITQLAINFYTPSSSLPIFSVNDVSNNVVTYRFLTIGLDIGAHSLFGNLDVGKDTFAEGGPGTSAHEFYLVNAGSPRLFDTLGGPGDSRGVFVVTIVPEPSTWTFCLAALVFGIASSRRTRPKSGLLQSRLTCARPVQYIPVRSRRYRSKPRL